MNHFVIAQEASDSSPSCSYDNLVQMPYHALHHNVMDATQQVGLKKSIFLCCIFVLALILFVSITRPTHLIWIVLLHWVMTLLVGGTISITQ